MANVKDILERKGHEVCTIGPGATARDAAQLMNEHRIGSLVVVEGRRVVGIVTERDMMDRIVADERDPAVTTVGEIMTVNPATCTPETVIDECRGIMLMRRIRRLPVVVDGALIGIVTQGDVMRQQIEEQRTTIGYLNEYLESPPTPHGS